MNTPIYRGLAQSDLDMAGFRLLNWTDPGGPGGGGASREFDVKTYGAIGDGTADDTTAIQAALAAIPSTGAVLYFPAGTYKYTGATLALNKPVTVRGDGGGVEQQSTAPGAISTIIFNSATASLFNVTVDGCTFRDLELFNNSGTTPSAGAGIVVSANGDQTNFQNLTIYGFYIDIDVQTGVSDRFDNCMLVAPVLYALKLRDIPIPDGGDHSISNCWFHSGAGRTATSAIRIESGGGVKIVNCKTNAIAGSAFLNGIDLAVADSVTTVDLLVSNCSIEGYRNIGIKGTTGTSSYWGMIVLTGNQFGPYAGGSPYGINLSATNAGDFWGINISGNFGGADFCSTPFIYLLNCSNVALNGNAHRGFSQAVQLGAGLSGADGPVYAGIDARLVPITNGVKLQVRNAAANTWVDADSWTNP